MLLKRKRSLIRDTEITAEEVYRCLAFRGMSEEAVLSRYPQLGAEDLAGTKQTVVADMQRIDRDEWTGRPILPKNELTDGAYYKGRCRNATIARWNSQENCFYHWREKFTAVFIETIKYPADEDPWFDVFFPVEQLSASTFDIPFAEGSTFQGTPEDLNQFTEEMWSKVAK